MLRWAAQVKNYVDLELPKFLMERQSKVSLPVPSNVLLMPALEIKNAASGAKLSSFREVLNYESLHLSFCQSSQYESAGTVFMCDFVGEGFLDDTRPSQLQSAAWMWSEEAYRLPSPHASSRRFSFDVPFPVKVVDVNVAQKFKTDNN